MAVAMDFLRAVRINARISQLRVSNDTLQRIFRCSVIGGVERSLNPDGGPTSAPSDLISDQGGMDFYWDIFNGTRAVPGERPFGVSAENIAPQPVGAQRGSYPRSAEKVNLLAAVVDNQRPIGALGRDVRGEQYVMDQERILAQRMVNLREFQLAAMLRGGYDYSTIVGESIRHAFPTSTPTINFQIDRMNDDPNVSGNTIVGVSWATAATCTPADDLLELNQRMEETTGYGIKHVWMNSTVWALLLNSTQILARAGSANTPYLTFQRDPNFPNMTVFEATLAACPWVVFHICDEVLVLSGSTNTKIFPDKFITCFPEPSAEWFQYYAGSEPIAENEQMESVERYGAYFWNRRRVDPTVYELHGSHVGIPAPKVPKNIMHWRVVAA